MHSDPALETLADPRWLAVRQRDGGCDGAFVYAVATTGVYCRPACAARRPRLENVRFYTNCAAAEAAGFRPCLRCKPNQPALAPLHEKVAAACRLIEHAAQMPSLAALSKAAGLSPFHFHRVFKAATGITPKAYAIAQRDRKLDAALDRPGTVTQAIYDAGFNTSGRFYAGARQAIGMTATARRAGGAGEHIRFATATCTLGTILVAGSAAGICAISLGGDPNILLRELTRRFHAATISAGDTAFERQLTETVAFVEAPQRGLALPLDIRGTVFQRRVWQALRDIPPGATASYSEIAARIGAPAAIRAVAGACAANTLAIAVPCHRVLGKGGALTGYRWGVATKRRLLDLEADAG